MTNARLLIVDDEPQILRALRPGLLAAGYQVEAVGCARDALQAAAERAFDIVIVDLGLPDMDGKDLIARMRQWIDTPIIVLSARGAEEEKIAALDNGAQDFVNKPFGIGELMARIRAILRARSDPEAWSESLTLGHLEVDFESKRTRVSGKEVRLSPREFKLLHALAQRLDQVLTHDQIAIAVWGPEQSIETQFIRVLVGNLRQKVERDPTRPALVITEAGVGYRLARQPVAPR